MTENSGTKIDTAKKEVEIVIEGTMMPQKGEGVTVREEIEEDGKYILFNAEHELILVTNSTGKFILDNCNGNTTVDQIAEELKNHFTVKEGLDMLAITKEFVATLLKVELVKVSEE